MGEICGYISNKNIENHKAYNDKILNTEKLTITIDGEIENKEEICKELNTNFITDTELLEKLYIKYGEEFVYKIEGFFVIAIYDKKENKLIMVRDKIGVKQLYYYIKENEIYFASELKAIMQYPNFTKKINYKTLSMYFRYSYINPPNTIFEDTYKLEHGHYIIWQNGKIENKIYWDGIERFNYLSQNTVNNFVEAKQNIKAMIKKYLEKVINSNENFGIYLSGGVDSSLVASICKEISTKPINTFSVGFYEEERNEADNAKKIAKYLGTNHHETYINKEELLNIIKKIPEYYDEPFADGSQIPTIILNEFAKENNITIAITGDGADQLFCGSDIYDRVNKMQKIFNPFNINIFFLNKKNQSQINLLMKEKQFKGLFKDVGDKRYNFEDKINSKSWQIKRMMVDVNTFLANRINTKTNKASAPNGIKIKSPFLENELIEYSFKIPQKFKYCKKEKKYILKQILYDYIPKELLGIKKKGFGIPIKKWLTTYLYEDLLKVSNKEFITKQQIFNYETLNKLIKQLKQKEKHKKHIPQILWDFYMFQLWYIKYIEHEE